MISVFVWSWNFQKNKEKQKFKILIRFKLKCISSTGVDDKWFINTIFEMVIQ